MKKHRRITKRHVLTAAALASMSIPLAVATRDDGPRAQDPASAARASVAQRLGRRPDDLRLKSPRALALPLTGKTVHRFKIPGEQGRAAMAVAVDQVGREVDAEALLRAEDAAHRKTFGKMHPLLAEKLSRTQAQERIPVSIWLRVDEPEAGPKKEPISGSESRARPRALASATSFLTQVRQARAKATEPSRRRLFATLAKLDPAAKMDAVEPILHARLTRAQIRTIEGSADVLSVDEITTDLKNELDVVKDDVNYAPEVHSTLGLKGAGKTIAMLEINGRIAANPALDQITHLSSDACASPTGHGTGVAGVLVSSDATRTGVAPSANLLAGGGCDSSTATLEQHALEAMNRGAVAINLSYGKGVPSANGYIPVDHDRFFDSVFSNHFRLVVKSAGNRGGQGCSDGTDGKLTSPGLGYNTLTVGAYDDDNFAGGTRSMWPCSSYVNPASTNMDREKPELVAPGVGITTTGDASPWSTWSGTSFAAPVVTGTIALMAEADPSLESWPEAVKSILMVTARSVEGASRLSDKDGAGAIDAFRAVRVAQHGSKGDWRGFTVDCNSFPLTFTRDFLSGQVTRVAINWHQDTNWASYAFRPSADLDLEVLDASGQVVPFADSLSWDNTYEIVEFTPPTSGTYTVRVTAQRCDTSPRYIGAAWYQR